jgi:hypothetical protein
MTNEAGMNAGATAKVLSDQKVASLQFATAQGRPAETIDSGIEKISRKACAMNGIFLFITPAVAALGALVLLGLFAQALNAAKTNRARVRVPARRKRSH